MVSFDERSIVGKVGEDSGQVLYWKFHPGIRLLEQETVRMIDVSGSRFSF